MLFAYTVWNLRLVNVFVIELGSAGAYIHTVRVDNASEVPARPRSAVNVNVLEEHAL